jgi:hypothetical protein
MATSVAPSQPQIEMTVHRITVLGVGGVGLVGLRTSKLHLAIGAEALHDSVEALLGPLQLLAQAGDEDPGVSWADLVIGGPELPTQGLRGDEPGQLFLVIEPRTQRLTYSSVA